MKLWLVRHAQPLIAPGLCYGRLDVAADAHASADCARQLAFELPAGVRVVVSPLQRCGQLAQALQSLRPALAFQTDARLQEMDFGGWEGRAWQEIDRAELQAWTDDFAHYAAGRTGESVTAFMARVASAFDALGQRPEDPPLAHLPATPGSGTPCHTAGEPQSDVLWITHAGVIRAVELLAQGMRHLEHAGQWPLKAPNYGQWRTWELNTGPGKKAAGRGSAPRPGGVGG